MAKRQNKRIWEAQRLMQKASEPSNERPLDGASIMARMNKMDKMMFRSNVEAHFFLICWDAISKVIDALHKKSYGLNAQKQVWERHKATLKRYKAARDHVEHWTERSPGEEKDQWQRYPHHCFVSAFRFSSGDYQIAGDMGLVRLERKFTFQNQEVGIGPDSAALLERICRQLREELTAEVRAIAKKQGQ